jgi:hypothetical protein
MFANHYIGKNIVYPRFIHTGPTPGTRMIVMIPCLNEPEIIRTLESLWNCDFPESACETIVVVNESENSLEEVKAANEKTYVQLLQWKQQNDRAGMVLYPIYARSVDPKSAGAGMARKIGMDEAIRRFNDLNRPNGILISLDADCLVSPDYLQVIARTFNSDKRCFAATLNFRHQEPETADEKQRLGIRLYEDYLHYYKKALDFAGFPNSIYTIGSAFAVRADAYVKQGGMNRRQAGEDFYFLNKLTGLGEITEITEAFVYPSARVSDRVPFGTGAAMNKWMNAETDLTLTYNFNAFLDLKKLFDQVNSLFRVDAETYSEIKAALPKSIADYFKMIDFERKLDEINKYSSSLSAFRKRFFQFFDAFVIMRFLNIAHQDYYQRQDLSEAISRLKEASGQ